MRKSRVNLPNWCYHLISRVAHRAFFLDDGERKVVGKGDSPQVCQAYLWNPVSISGRPSRGLAADDGLGLPCRLA